VPNVSDPHAPHSVATPSPLTTPLANAPSFSRRLLAVLVCCAAVAWLSGPAGRLLVALPLLLFGPGYLLERAFPASQSPTAFVRPAIWLGLSLSIVALLYEWTTALGLALMPPLLELLAGLCAAGVIWRIWRGSVRDAGVPRTFAAGRPAFSGWWGIALLGVFALTLWTRFTQIQELALPAWVDSVHHALMIRVAAERGQVPYSLRPYLPVDQLPYHWGYHVFMAAVWRLAGLPLGQTMLWVGQVLNALHVLTIAALAAYLWRRPLAGIVAAIVVGLLSIMPAYYVSWGRYTQLAGLLLVAPLAITWHAGLRTRDRRQLVYSAIMLAGLSLIHFRVLVFMLCLLGADAVVWAISERPAGRRAGLWFGVISAGLALALAAPWLWNIAVRTLLPAVASPQGLLGESGYNGLNESLLWAGQNRVLIAIALVAALVGLLRRSAVVVAQVGWVAALFVLANPWMIGYLLPAGGALLALWGVQTRRLALALGGAALMLLNPALVSFPYLWLITNDAVVISLFIPISVLIGGGVCWLAEWFSQAAPTLGGPRSLAEQWQIQRWRVLPRWGLAVALTLLALWGAWGMRSVINSATVLASTADVAAIDWVATHTPTDARFLINATPWLSGVDRGTDGGWWLLPLTGRWTSTPPVLYTYGAPDDVQAARALSAAIAGFHSGQEQQLYQLIERERIGYIYLGPQPGPLSPATFAGNAGFKTVYERDGVTILAVLKQS